MKPPYHTIILTVILVTMVLPAGDVPIPLTDKWTKIENTTISVGSEDGLGTVMKIDGDFMTSTFALVSGPMVKGDMSAKTVKGLTLTTRGEGLGAVWITLGRRDGAQWTKYAKEIPLSPTWKRWTIPLTGFRNAEGAFSTSDWESCVNIMFTFLKPERAAASASLASLAWVDHLPPPSETTIPLLDFTKEIRWQGAVSVVEAPDRPGKKALRLDASVPTGMTLSNMRHDWSPADTFAMDIHSANATGARIELVLHSSRPGDAEGACLFKTLAVDWTGWRRFEFPFARFTQSRNPAGLGKIDRFRWVVEGWGNKATPCTALSIQSIEAFSATDAPPIAPPPEITEQHRTGLAIIKARAAQTLIPELSLPLDGPGADISNFLASQGEDGSWADVDYGAKSTLGWAPVLHLERLAAMATAWVRLGLTHPDDAGRKKLKCAIDLGLNYWFTRDPQADSWWHNMIGPQLVLTKIALALDPVLTPEQRRAIVHIFLRSKTDGMTGGNLTWTAGHTIMRACLEGKPEVAAKAFRLIADEVRLAPGNEEGVKVDGAFHQHGQQIYNNGYGRVYALDASRWFFYAAGTAYRFPDEKFDALSRYVLDGNRWMVYRNVFDYSCTSRDVTRLSKGPNVSYLAEVCRYLKVQEGPRQGELAAFEKEISKGLNSLVGNKHFWKSDYMAHRRTNFLFSVKMLSRRMLSGEWVNGEGKRSHLLSDGLTYLYTGDGLGYHNIFPVWDWKRLPGITAEWGEEPPKGRQPCAGETLFAGGVSEGGFGVAAMHHRRGGLEAKKSYFFFDREMVALGSDIRGDGQVNTTLDQSLLTGAVTVSMKGQERPATAGARYEQAPDYVHHRELGFIPLLPQAMVLTVAPRTGTWGDIGSSAPGLSVTQTVFTLWVDHPAARGSGYAYAVVGGSLADTRAWATNKPVRVLANSGSLAAVHHPGLGILQAVFYDAAGLRTDDGLSVTTDGCALLMLRQTNEGLVLSVAHPEAREGFLGVRLSRKLNGPGASWDAVGGSTRLRIPLPGGEEAGRTVSVALSDK